MNRTISRVLWIAAGILLILAGIFCLLSPSAALSGLALYLGLAMLFSGIVDIVINIGNAVGYMHDLPF